MKEVDEVIARISKKKGRSHYQVLSSVVEATFHCLPKEAKIGAICEEVGRECGKSGGTVYKDLSRKVDDLWEYEDHEELKKTLAYSLCLPPTTKELVLELAQAVLRETEKRVEYYVLEVSCPTGFGIWGRSLGPDARSAAVAPFGEKREKAERIVAWLNQEQVPLDVFVALFQRNELPQFE